jgi:hypothetical protein
MAEDGSDFSLAALYAAMDEEREARGLSWRDAAREINGPFDHVTSRPIALSTITSTRTKEVAEGDGVLQMLRWLRRTPESFVRGADNPGSDALFSLRPDQILRFDTRKLYEALNARRSRDGKTWLQLARDLGMSASSLMHLAKGGRTGFPHVLRLTRWLKRPVADFTRACSR